MAAKEFKRRRQSSPRTRRSRTDFRAAERRRALKIPNDEADRWEIFVDDLAKEVKRRLLCEVDAKAQKAKRAAGEREAAATTPPFDKPWSHLKREIYRYVLDCIATGKTYGLELGIDRTRKRELPRKPSFNENPFHWALLGMQGEIEDLRDPDVSRFGRQMLYASIHKVPPRLLVGFLHQTGNPKSIGDKLIAGLREPWIAEVSD